MAWCGSFFGACTGPKLCFWCTYPWSSGGCNGGLFGGGKVSAVTSGSLGTQFFRFHGLVFAQHTCVRSSVTVRNLGLPVLHKDVCFMNLSNVGNGMIGTSFLASTATSVPPFPSFDS